MQRIAMDTIGPLPESMNCKFIIVLIDTFTRYVELFPSQTVSATSAADALWKHFCRFTTPLEIMTDQGTQFMNQTLTHLATLSGMKHHVSIPYSKEENGIVERANKEVNRHIRNIVADKDCVHDWPKLLCMTEKLLNSSVKQPLGASPNTLLLAMPSQRNLV
jgi:transposase InsO family protein